MGALLREYLLAALRKPSAVTTGRLIALEPPSEETDEQRDARLRNRLSAINKLALEPLRDEDVFVFGANVCNNVIDSYDSRFTEKALPQMARLVPGAPMTIGHEMGGRSYARSFEADVVRGTFERERAHQAAKKPLELRDLKQASWVRSLSYTLLNTSFGKDQAAAIRGGLEKEVSAHWFYETSTCGICADDIRTCEHWPGDEYEVEGKKVRCWYEMDDVREYLETAFVVRGGQLGTSMFLPEQAASRGVTFDTALRELKSNAGLRRDWRQQVGKGGPVSLAETLQRAVKGRAA